VERANGHFYAHGRGPKGKEGKEEKFPMQRLSKFLASRLKTQGAVQRVTLAISPTAGGNTGAND